VSGLAVGSMYALVALGHVLIWNAMGILNFAHGELVMIGAFLGLTFHVIWGLPFFLSFILAGLSGAIIGAFLRRTVYYYLFRRRAMAENYLIASIGISILLINIALLIWGSMGFSFPEVFGSAPFQIGGIRIIPRNIWILAIGVAVMIVLTVFLKKTKLGRGMRATAQDKEAAAMMGINVDEVDTFTFALASAIGALAGILLAPVFFVTTAIGQLIGLKAFAAAVIGGFNSILGAVIGGLFIGVLENVIAGYVSSTYKDAISFSAMIITLIIIPTGLMGGRRGD
jgi:branched-chain amino acid transport system permease protein